MFIVSLSYVRPAPIYLQPHFQDIPTSTDSLSQVTPSLLVTGFRLCSVLIIQVNYWTWHFSTIPQVSSWS